MYGLLRAQRRHVCMPDLHVRRPRAPGSPEPYRFLSVFKWEKRKGWDILLPAYVSEFRFEPNVELHILTKATFEKVSV